LINFLREDKYNTSLLILMFIMILFTMVMPTSIMDMPTSIMGMPTSIMVMVIFMHTAMPMFSTEITSITLTQALLVEFIKLPISMFLKFTG
jgi:hypothetical protein